MSKHRLAALLLCVLSLASALQAKQECKIKQDVLQAIAAVEGHPKRKIGYPYLISFNKQSDMNKLTKDSRWVALDKRTIDCKSLEGCVSIFHELMGLNISNVDLGAFQINPNFFKYDASDYFVLETSRQKACEILMGIKNIKGWSWESLARYHSGNKKHNQAYQERLRGYVAKQEKASRAVSKVQGEKVATHTSQKLQIRRIKIDFKVASN